MKRKLSTTLLTLLILSMFFTNAFAANADLPNIYGKSGIVVDVKTGEIIYSKNIDKSPMFPASTTKLLTALLFAENKKPTDVIKYTPNSAKQPEYTLKGLVGRSKLTTNDTMLAEDVMKALLMFSANDSAYMVADSIAKSPQDFEKMMNDKIKQLGLKNTHFVTPNGLDDGIDNHYSSAYDMSVILREAYKNPWVRKTLANKKDKVSISNGTIAYIENRNKLLNTRIDTSAADKAGIDLNQQPISNALCVGGKTGYTGKAGRCLTAIFDKDGRTLAGVVLNSVYDAKDSYVFNDMAKMINWSYSAKKTPLYKANTVVKTIPLKYKPLIFIGPEKEIQVPLMVKKNVDYYENSINKSEIKTNFNIPSLKVNNLSKNKSLGTLVVKERESTKNYDLYTNISFGTVFKQNILLYGGLLCALIILIILIYLLIRKFSKKRRRRRRLF